MKGGQGRRVLEIKDFSGGLVTKSPPKNIEMRFSVDCLNVYTEGATLRRRDGIAAVNGTATTGDGNGLYNWIRGSATTAQWLMGVWGANLVKMDITGGAWDGTWDAITADAASGTAFTTAGGLTYFANFNGVLLISNDNRERIQRMTVSESSYLNIETGGSGTAPLAKFVINWKNHAWFLNCQGSEDRVVHSAVNSYNNFTGSTYGANDLLSENDIGITGGFILNGRLYVTKAFSIHRFTYTGSPSPLVDIRTIKSVVGTKAPRTIRNVNTPEGEVVMFLGTNKKLYLCDGQDTQEISDAIDLSNGLTTVYMQAINEKIFNKCFAVVHEDLNWYELFFGVGTGTDDKPTHSLVYDYRIKSFWPMSNRNFTYGIISDNGSQKRVVYVQGTNGKAYLLNSTNSDDGTAISYRWTSEKIGSPILLNKIDELEVETAVTSAVTSFSWRADWETNWTSYTMSSGTNSNNFSPNRIDNMIQFQVTGNDTVGSFKLWTILGSERIIGGGK
jgi:hypothetical protein